MSWRGDEVVEYHHGFWFQAGGEGVVQWWWYWRRRESNGVKPPFLLIKGVGRFSFGPRVKEKRVGLGIVFGLDFGFGLIIIKGPVGY